MDKNLGRTLGGRYRLDALIGVGGMANVYQGTDLVENRIVAVKILKDEFAGNSEFLERFRNESRAIAMLNHPNIVRIYDVILDTPTPVIVMEYVGGITLRDYMDRKTCISPKVATALVLQILLALQHAHEYGIVHLDIKPQNIKVLSNGTIKVMDFGIARFTIAYSGMRRKGEAVGSVHYVSPEQAQGAQVIDQRSDLYSVGVILYEMLTGQVPFDDSDPNQIAAAHVRKIPARVGDINPDIPYGLEDIVWKAMAKIPARRYQSAGEMLDDLRAFARNPEVVFGYADSPMEPLPASQPRQIQKPQSKNGYSGGSASSRQSPYGGHSSLPEEPEEEYDDEEEPDSAPKGKHKKKTGKKRSFLTILFGITCAFVLGTLGFVGVMFYLNNPFQPVPEVDMPQLVGRQYTDVLKDKTLRNNFNFELTEETYRQNYDEGEIYEQYPTSGKRVKVGSTVKLKVSIGLQRVTIPDFSNQEAVVVLAKLEDMGLQPQQNMVESEEVPAGNVIRTEPGPNHTVSEGSTVVVIVSKGDGKEKKVVPDVTGQTLMSAQQILIASGFEVGEVLQMESDRPEGTVLAQSPSYPMPMPVGSKISLTVAQGYSYNDRTNSGQQVVTILCPMPTNITRNVRLSAEQDGMEFMNTTLVPSEARMITIRVPGQYGQTTITIYLNNQIYRSYRVNFDTMTPSYEDLIDNSAYFAGY